MPKTNIMLKALAHYRKNQKLSKKALARMAKCSEKTIARIENNNPTSTVTANKLAKALQIDVKLLKTNPEDTSPDEKMRYFGFKFLREHIPVELELAFQMVEANYGIDVVTQIRMAPLFTVLLAEGSLAWRRQRLQEIRKAGNSLGRAEEGHLAFIDRASYLEELAKIEAILVNEGDIFGKSIEDFKGEQLYTLDLNAGMPDPFTAYLIDLAKQLDTKSIEISKNDFAVRNFRYLSLGYSINPRELQRLTGGNSFAMLALERGHVRISDIPEHLWLDAAADERIAWIASKLPQAERDEYLEWKAEREAETAGQPVDGELSTGEVIR